MVVVNILNVISVGVSQHQISQLYFVAVSQHLGFEGVFSIWLDNPRLTIESRRGAYDWWFCLHVFVCWKWFPATRTITGNIWGWDIELLSFYIGKRCYWVLNVETLVHRQTYVALHLLGYYKYAVKKKKANFALAIESTLRLAY